MRVAIKSSSRRLLPTGVTDTQLCLLFTLFLWVLFCGGERVLAVGVVCDLQGWVQFPFHSYNNVSLEVADITHSRFIDD